MTGANCWHGESATREVVDDVPNKTDLAMGSNITISNNLHMAMEDEHFFPLGQYIRSSSSTTFRVFFSPRTLVEQVWTISTPKVFAKVIGQRG